MSQVDDWSDGYTSDYLRDLNTRGPASANVPRTSSVVSHQVQYQPPVAQTEAKTNDTPLYSGGREDLWNIRSGQDSGWQGRAGQGSDWGSSGRSSSSRSRSQSGESGTGRSSGRSSGRSTNSRVGRSASSGTGSRSTISGADVTADVMKALKADGNTSFADWRSSLKRQGFANADSIKYDPTTGKFIDTTGGSMPSAPTGTYKDASDPMSQRILANSTTDNSGAGSGRVAESVVGAAQDITDQASPYRAVAALAGADNVGSPGGASGTKTAADIQQDDIDRAYDWTATGNAGTGGFSPERPMIDSSDAASGIPPEIMARLKKDADDGSPWGLLPWALGPTYKPIAGLLPAGQKLLPAGQKLLPYNGEAAAGAVGSKAGEAAAGDAAAGAGGRSFGFDLSAEDVAAANAANAAAKQQAVNLSEMRSTLIRAGVPDREIEAYMRGAGFYNDPEALRQAIDVVRKYGIAGLFEHSAARAGSAAGTGAGSAAGTGSRGSFRFDLSPEEIASAKASHDAYVRGAAGAADGGVSKLAEAGNVGRETAAGAATGSVSEGVNSELIQHIRSGTLDEMERAWIEATAAGAAKAPGTIDASTQAILNEARAAGILGRDAAGTAGAADGGVSELANAGNVGRETAAGAATGAAGTAGSGAIDSTTKFLIKQIKTGKLDDLERAWVYALADRGARNPQLLSASERALVDNARAAGILDDAAAAGAARGAPQGTVAGAGSKARWDEIPDANGMTRSRADEVLAREEIRRYDPRTTREGIARYIENDLKTLAGKPGYETPYQAFQTLMSQWGKYNPDLGQDPYNYIWRLAVWMFK